MKIRLNENEFYEIKLPEEITIAELPMITNRFTILAKSFSKFNMVEGQAEGEGEEAVILGANEKQLIRKKRDERFKFLRENREVFVEVLDTYYHCSREEWDKLLLQYDLVESLPRNYMCSPNIIRLREHHNVNPNEIGLIKFPTRNEQIVNLKLETP